MAAVGDARKRLRSHNAEVEAAPSKFDQFHGYYSVRFSGIEFARFAPSPVWSEYANAMQHVPDFSYSFVATEPRNIPSGVDQ